MKTFLIAAFALLTTLTSTQAQITVTSPNTAEDLPQNGQLFLWWSNSVPLQVTWFLDQYNDQGTFVQTVASQAHGYSISGVDYSYVSPDRFVVPPVGLYKVRVSGWDQHGSQFTDESDEFFRITVSAQMLCVMHDSGPWFPGATKTFTISWENFEVGNSYKVFLYSPTMYFGEGYGFNLRTGTIPSKNGSITFEAPFSSHSAYPGYSDSPIDGIHEALFINERNYVRTSSGPINVVVNDVRIQVIPQVNFTANYRTPIHGLKLHVDARYAASDVKSITIPLSFYATDRYTKIRCALFEGNRQVSRAHIVAHDDDKYTAVNLVTHNLVIPSGTTTELTLKCEIMAGSGLFEFGLDGFASTADAQGKKGVNLTLQVIHNWGPIVEIMNK